MSMRWDMKPARRELRKLAGAALDLAPPEVVARASSRYDLEDIDRRLRMLAGREDYEAVAERAYLLKLRAKET